MHDARDELFWRQAPQRTVFGWNDHIEAARRLGNDAFPGQSVESEPSCGSRHAEGLAGIT